MKKICTLLLGAVIISSCYTSQHLHHTGTYTIKERKGNVTEFYEVKGTYHVISDTLKKNDKIVINVIKTRPFKRNDKMKGNIAQSLNNKKQY